jgi:hypothetical protein
MQGWRKRGFCLEDEGQTPAIYKYPLHPSIPGDSMSTDYRFSYIIKTEAPKLVVMEAVQDALRPLGGVVRTNDDKGIISIVDGKIGIFGDFLFDCTVKINVIKKGDGKYKIKCMIEKSPNHIFWLILIAGLCTSFWPIWFFNFYYLFIDLGKEYQKKMEGVESFL